MQLLFEMNYRSTHDSLESFKSSLTENQLEMYRFLCQSYFSSPVNLDGDETRFSESCRTLVAHLVNIWESNEEIHHVVAACANDYWRQFAFWRQPFEMMHFGQQLHVLASLYNLCRSYINEHNLVKRGDLNHNDLPIYNATTQSFKDEQ